MFKREKYKPHSDKYPERFLTNVSIEESLDIWKKVRKQLHRKKQAISITPDAIDSEGRPLPKSAAVRAIRSITDNDRRLIWETYHKIKGDR